MQVQKCKICRNRHHRYDPHVWDGLPDDLPEIPAAPEVRRNSARSPIPRKPDKAPTKPSARPGETAMPPSASLPQPSPFSGKPGTPDTTPSRSPRPLNVAALDDAALDNLRNLVMREVLKRRRAKRIALTTSKMNVRSQTHEPSSA